jgi:hypothetical protein
MTVALAGAPKDSFTCASCHPQQALSQPDTSMGRALQLPRFNLVLKAHPKLTFRHGTYSYNIETRDDEITYSVTDGTNIISVPIKWAFGAGSQTYVLEREGRLYESMVSFYPQIDALDITMGDQAIQPKTLGEAFGRELAASESKACFGCHATGGGELRLESLTPGIQCERCHAGANDHLQGMVKGKPGPAPKKLGRLSAEELSNFCGQCHRSWETVVRDRLRGEINVRFQPYRLANSKCFDGSDSRIGCVACHDPHREAVHDRGSYDRKCLACHATPAAQPVNAKTCPVASSGCVNCHMPKVSLPGGHQIFTDHTIRVVRANEPYPN